MFHSIYDDKYIYEHGFYSIDPYERPIPIELLIPGGKAYLNDMWGIETFASGEYFDKVELGFDYFQNTSGAWIASYFANDKDIENPSLVGIRVFDIESLTNSGEDPCIEFYWF